MGVFIPGEFIFLMVPEYTSVLIIAVSPRDAYDFKSVQADVQLYLDLRSNRRKIDTCWGDSTEFCERLRREWYL